MKFKYLLFLSAFFFSTLNQAQNNSYKILRKIPVPGNGGWDYLTVDTLYHRLFVSHSSVVQVIDLKSGDVTNTIENTKGVHGITLAYDLQKGYISNGRDTSVFVFDLKTLKVIKRIKVTGMNPDAILYDAFSHHVFVFNGRSFNATVIDASRDEVITTIELKGKPEFAATDLAGKIFVNIEDKSEVCSIDAKTLKVLQYWSITPAEEPSGLAIDRKNKLLFSVCDNKMMAVSDITTGKLLKTIPIGKHPDGAAFDEVLQLAFSSNGEGTLTIVREEKATSFNVSETVNTQESARTIALDQTTHHVFLPAAEYGPVPVPVKENTHPRSYSKELYILELGQ